MWLTSDTQFAGYTIVRMLGFGATGEVYLAQRAGLTRHDALKVLSAAMSADVEFRDRFTGEAETATTLRHPHIVDTHERGECDGRLWTAMDYVEGANAAVVLAERHPAGMPIGEALGIIAAAAGALDYAHRRGILHRAVKPNNILLVNASGQQRILLADFGIARSGLADYAAPEQVKGLAIDERTDQYGLAATAFYLLTGVPPFQHTGIGQRLGVAPPKLSDRRPELAPLDAVLATALAENPSDRFGRCAEFAAALSERARGLVGVRGPVVDYPDDAEPETTAGTRRFAMTRRPLILLAAAVMLVIAGLWAGIMIGRPRQAPAPQAANPSTSIPVPAAVPTTSVAAVPAPDQLLDGSYQMDINRAQQTYNDLADPQPPNVTTWWAFRSVCTPTACAASGVQLDDNDHQRASGAGDQLIVLDFRAGAWQSRPQTLRFPCLGPHGESGSETTTQVLLLRPQAHGPWHGEMTVTIESNECGQQGGKVAIPAVAGRVGPVPPGVDVPPPGR